MKVLTLNLQVLCGHFDGGWFTDGGHTGVCPSMRGLEGVKVQQETGRVALRYCYHGYIWVTNFSVVRVPPFHRMRKFSSHITGQGVLVSSRQRVGSTINTDIVYDS